MRVLRGVVYMTKSVYVRWPSVAGIVAMVGHCVLEQTHLI